MEYIDRIADFERRAQAINLTLHGLCRLAGVNYHHITRWRARQVNPTVRALDRDLSKLDAELTRSERSVFDRLAEKFTPGRPAA